MHKHTRITWENETTTEIMGFQFHVFAILHTTQHTCIHPSQPKRIYFSFIVISHIAMAKPCIRPCWCTFVCKLYLLPTKILNMLEKFTFQVQAKCDCRILQHASSYSTSNIVIVPSCHRYINFVAKRTCERFEYKNKVSNCKVARNSYLYWKLFGYVWTLNPANDKIFIYVQFLACATFPSTSASIQWECSLHFFGLVRGSGGLFSFSVHVSSWYFYGVYAEAMEFSACAHREKKSSHYIKYEFHIVHNEIAKTNKTVDDT